jgi:hypothetical protein
MLYCQSSPDDHRAAAVYAVSFNRRCGHDYPVRSLACLTHGAELKAHPQAVNATACERCGQPSPLTLTHVEDVFEERVTISLLRSTLEGSVHSPITFAYDRAVRILSERGMHPVATYRAPVRWRSAAPSLTVGTEIIEASVTLAVTLPVAVADKAG